MLALNFLPLLHAAAVVTVWLLLPDWKFTAALALLYLGPPLTARLVLLLRPVKDGTHAAGSPEFLTWWATAQCQMIFCRLPLLEEVLRLVPGFYSMWLRLWGAQIGRLTFWAPGLRILDRSFLRVGDHVVFGAGVRLNAHVIAQEDGRTVLHLAAIKIGDRCHIGGYALLTAGTEVEAGEVLKAFTLCPPFTRWTASRRVRPAVPREAASSEPPLPYSASP